jgi:hypothetical protein
VIGRTRRDPRSGVKAVVVLEDGWSLTERDILAECQRRSRISWCRVRRVHFRAPENDNRKDQEDRSCVIAVDRELLAELEVTLASASIPDAAGEALTIVHAALRQAAPGGLRTARP